MAGGLIAGIGSQFCIGTDLRAAIAAYGQAVTICKLIILFRGHAEERTHIKTR